MTPSLCRVALLVARTSKSTSPADRALIAVIEDLVARVNRLLRERGRDCRPEQSYRLCRAIKPLDPQKTLDECSDGERFGLPARSAETYEPVTEMVSTQPLARPTRCWPRSLPKPAQALAGHCGHRGGASDLIHCGGASPARMAISAGSARPRRALLVVLVAHRGLSRAQDQTWPADSAALPGTPWAGLRSFRRPRPRRCRCPARQGCGMWPRRSSP